MIHSAFSQSGEWAWVHGDTVANAPGHYGVKGIADPANRPPGLYEPFNWTDRNGNLWIYGGYNTSVALCADMWMYNPYTNLWTWMQGDSTHNVVAVHGTKGIPSPLNTPGSRNTGVTWVDTAGNFWLYGGFLNGLLFSGDLWMFNTATLEWTWMSGSQNTGTAGTLVLGIPSSIADPPTVVETSTGWINSQNQLWMYGGMYTNTCCPYDRVLRYSISTNEWTWIRGSAGALAPTVWGTMGVAAATNNPGARSAYAHWEDGSGNFWFANGYNYAETWKYNPAGNEWTWMSGSQTTFYMGNYVSYCDTSSGNYRSHSEENKACYKDRYNQVWQFGGTSANNNDNFNDLWIYDYTSLKYKWMHGTNLLNQPAVFGQQGIPAATNIPHSRDGAILFGDSLCHIYLFAGMSRHPGQATYNDVWKFYPDSSCSRCFQNVTVASFNSPNQVCPGSCIDFTNLSVNGTSYQWSFPGAVPNTSIDFSPSGICYNSPGSYDVTLIATGLNGSDTITFMNYITVYPYPPPQGIIQSGDTLFANAGSLGYQWFYNGNMIAGATDYFYIAPQSGNYNVVCTDSNNCEVEAAIFDVTADLHDAGNAAPSLLQISPNPGKDFILIRPVPDIERAPFFIYNVIGEEVLRGNSPGSGTGGYLLDISELDPAPYFIKVITPSGVLTQKFFKE